jgi:hypothetical protein
MSQRNLLTDRQARQLASSIAPQHPERKLLATGAMFESVSALLRAAAVPSLVNGRLVAGKNQNAGVETAQKMLAAEAQSES